MDIEKLHLDAMNFAEEAYIASLKGDKQRFLELSKRAYEHEVVAADALFTKFELEPSRSVLYRSAASLAIDVGQFRDAERLISAGLAGNPPEEIADELRDMWEQVNFRRHLDLRGVTLDRDEFQFSIIGNSVGFGISLSDPFIERVQVFEKILYRTAERKLGRTFREKGKLPKLIADNYPVYITIPRAASFAVSFKIGHPSEQLDLDLPNVNTSAEIIDEVVSCFELLNQNDDDLLKSSFKDEAYYNNFIGLAKQLAPDGKDVTQVGFTLIRGTQERRVPVTRIQKNMPSVTVKDINLKDSGERVRVKGVFLFADSMGTKKTIKLKDEIGNKYDVRVPPGMMGDIVKPLFEDTVVVEGLRKKSLIELENIWKAED